MNPDALPLWSSDDEFRNILKGPSGEHTLLDVPRLHVLYRAARCTREIPGMAAEVGVWRGGSARVICRTLPRKPVWLFDTFTGTPHIRPGLDLHEKGSLSNVSLAAVRRYLADCPNAEIIPGIFPQTATRAIGAFAFVHIDCDVYESVRDAVAWFWPRLRGLMVFDDYGAPSCPGALAAVDEFLASRSDRNDIYLPTGQLIVIRWPRKSFSDFP